MTAMSSTGIIILAAGASTRLGRPKQLLVYQGKTLLQRVLDEAALTPAAVRVLVLGAQANAIQAAVSVGDAFQVVWHEQWAQGMSGSLRAGLDAALTVCPDLDQVLILLSDQPYVTHALLDQLLATHAARQVLATGSAYGEVLGAPAVFSKAVFEDLRRLEGDRGAGLLMRQYPPDRLAAVPFAQGALDIDTEADYQRLK